jgi:NTE family protein
MQHTAGNKLGLALGCGGVKGVAHLGVIRCLLEHGIAPDYLAGSSAGALVGALYAHSGEISEVEGLFASLRSLRQGAKLVDIATRGGMLKGAKIEAFLDSYLKGATFDDLRLALTVVATDLNTGAPVLLASGPVAKAVRASISAAPVIQPLEYGGLMLSDGGLSNPVPADVLRTMGATRVIAVSLTNGYFEQQLGPEDRLDTIGSRGIAVLQANLARYTARDADVLIEPAIDNQSILGLEGLLDRQGLHKQIKAGFDATLVQIAAIKRALGEA